MVAMKRKPTQQSFGDSSPPNKKRQNGAPFLNIAAAFRADLFAAATLNDFKDEYLSSKPYSHAVVPSLIESNLLRSVRDEITTHISFTPKETDIYRIHQSGDLANLSNLDTDSLKHLPCLVKLRDALYSSEFRDWVSAVTGAGALSGRRTDMAVNVYTPGSFLLCHDDVIGSRRVSYILYLTDPEDPWQAEWGGGLRLYPTEQRSKSSGENVAVPLADHSVNIPPSFGQLSFFAVQPGESYHDVEEVYHAQNPSEDKRRIRMAISGWYHIPQQGEDGFEEGAEEAQAEKSSLAQLQGAADEFDLPAIEFKRFDEARVASASDAKHSEIDPGDDDDQNGDTLTEQDLTFLLRYLTPSFLTPDMTDRCAASFGSDSFVQLERFLNDRFAARLRQYIEKEDLEDVAQKDWKVARPPHKHRYAYLQTKAPSTPDPPIFELLNDLLHSHAFKKWLALITGLHASGLIKQNVIARRFRRGKDYALASGYRGDVPQLEFTIGMTPTASWSQEKQETQKPPKTKSRRGNGRAESTTRGDLKIEESDIVDFGGEEVYMAGDDDDDSLHSKSLPQIGKKADPAIYRSAHDDEEDTILFSSPASWNTLSVVLRDKGTLRFVKYISQAAKGDRWDIKGEFELDEIAFGDEDDGQSQSDQDDLKQEDSDDDENDSDDDDDDAENDENE